MNRAAPDTYYLNTTYAGLGNLTFALWASDASGNWATANLMSLMRDTLPPAIQHVPLEDSPLGDTIRIAAAVTDGGSGVQAVFLHYRGVGEQEFAAVEMSLDPETGMFFAVTPTQLKEGILHYYIEAVDAAGNVGRDPAAGAASPHEVTVFRFETPFPRVWILLGLLAAALVLVLLATLTRRRREEGPLPPEATVILETAEEATVCGICLGAIKAGLTVARCTTCGKVFHESCASRVANCLSCEEPIDMDSRVEIGDS